MGTGKRWTAWRSQEHFIFFEPSVFHSGVVKGCIFFEYVVAPLGDYRFPTFRRNMVPSSLRFQWYEKNTPRTARPSVVASYSSVMYFVVGRGTV
jgi:hypothetical protein